MAKGEIISNQGVTGDRVHYGHGGYRIGHYLGSLVNRETTNGSVKMAQTFGPVSPYNGNDYWVRAFVFTEDRTFVIEANDGKPLLVDLDKSELDGAIHAFPIDHTKGEIGDHFEYFTTDGVKHVTSPVMQAVFEESSVYDLERAVKRVGAVRTDRVTRADASLLEMLGGLSVAQFAQRPAVRREITGENRIIGMTGNPRDPGSKVPMVRLGLVADKKTPVNIDQAFSSGFSRAYFTTKSGTTYKLEKSDEPGEFKLSSDRDAKSGAKPMTVAMASGEIAVGRRLEFSKGIIESTSPVQKVVLEWEFPVSQARAQEMTGGQHDFSVESLNRTLAKDSAAQANLGPDLGR